MIEENLERELIDYISSKGLLPPERIEADDDIHRFRSSQEKKDVSGWYKVINRQHYVIMDFGCFRIGAKFQFRKKKEITEDKLLLPKVEWLKNKPLKEDAEHGYLKRKRIKSFGLRGSKGRLAIPVWEKGIFGEIAGIQYISENGAKIFHKGSKIEGNYYSLGSGEHSENIFLVEGYATGASIYESLGGMSLVCIAFGSGNLPSVCRNIRNTYRDKRIIIFADNDENGVGIRKAKLAKSLNRNVEIISTKEYGDANDFMLAGGNLKELIEQHFSKEEEAENGVREEESGDPDCTSTQNALGLFRVGSLIAEMEPQQWLIENWVPRESLIMVHGKPSSGKTFLALDWGLHLSSDRKLWFGNKVENGRTLYLAGEGLSGLKRRLSAWVENSGFTNPDLWIKRDSWDFLNEGKEYLRRIIESLGGLPDLIIVDTLTSYFDGNENCAQDARKMIDICNNTISDFGLSIILIHHTGVSPESQERGRGSSAWRGAMDIEVGLSRPEGEQGPIKIRQFKSRDSELAADCVAEFKTIQLTASDGSSLSSVVLREVKSWS